MRIVNPAINSDFETGHHVRLNLGSGSQLRSGYYNVDVRWLPGVDIVANLNEPLSEIPDSSVVAVYASHILEHVNNLVGLLTEIQRILVPGGELEIVVPHFSNPYGYSDPTHVRFFGLYTPFYFANPSNQLRRAVPSYHRDLQFVVEAITISFYRDRILDRVIAPVIQWLVNRNYETLDLYERHFCWLYPAHELDYILRVDK